MRTKRSTDRRPWWGAGLGVIILGVAACSSSGHSAAGSPRAVTTATPAAVATTIAPATTAPPAAGAAPAPAPTAAPAAAPGPDPATTLNGALDALTTSYHFVSTVTLDGSVALVADGDRVGDGSRLTLTSNGGNVSYVITPDGSWVMPEGGDWQVLDTDPANTDPIAALRTASAVQTTSNDGTTSHLSVAVAPAALGVAGDAPVNLDVAIAGNVLTSVSYGTTVSGKAARVTATFGPPQDPRPVTPPG
jgi:hypothetical protein